MSFAKNFRLNSKEVFDDVIPVNDYFKWLKKVAESLSARIQLLIILFIEIQEGYGFQ